MAEPLAPITDEELRAGDVRGRLGTIRKLAAICNAMLNCVVRSDTGKEQANLSGSNFVIEYIKGKGAGEAAATLYPWQPYASEWKGTGNDPQGGEDGDRKRRFRLVPGQINSRKPTNMATEFVASADAVTFLYLQVPVSENNLGKGDLLVGRPTIKTAQGGEEDDLITLIGNPPKGGSNGALPAYIVVGLGEVHCFEGEINYYPGYFSNLTVTLTSSGDCTSATRVFDISGTQQLGFF